MAHDPLPRLDCCTLYCMFDLLYIQNFTKMSGEQVAKIPNMGMKVMKNERSLASLTSKWPQKVVIFGKVKEKSLTYRVTLPDF